MSEAKLRQKGNSMIAKVIEMLGEEKDKIKAQLAALDEELTELGNEIAASQSEMDEAIAIREKEHSVFLKSEAEQVATVEQLEEMGVALKKQIAAFTATPPPVAEEEGAFLQKTEASPAATFDAFIQINSKTKEEEAAEKQAKFDKVKKALTMMVDTIW